MAAGPTISEVVFDILNEAETPLSINEIARELGAGLLITMDQRANIMSHIQYLRKVKRVVAITYNQADKPNTYAPIRRYFSDGTRIPIYQK